jgi:sugar lactone lactonase YvrE
MKKFIPFILLLLVIAACETKKSETSSAPALTLKWETDTLLTTSESVIYDEANDVLYVSNINGVPDAKDGNGFISIVSLAGKITNLNWVTGLDAPKGLGIYTGKLYVADIDRVHEIEIASGKVLNSFNADGAKFLNDIAVSSNGKVYVSDTGAGEVLVLENGVFSKLLTGLDGPNGLFVEGDALLVALWNSKTLNWVDLASKQLTMKADSLENPDGIEAIGNGAHLVSSWNGLVNYLDKDWNARIILDTQSSKRGAADIEYIQSKKLLLVPTFYKNSVAAYELK